MSLAPPTQNPGILYWQCFASVVDSWAPTAILKDKNAIAKTETLNKEIVTSDPAREGQGTVMVMTPGGILIYALATKNAIFCWNKAKPFIKENQYLLLEVSMLVPTFLWLWLKGENVFFPKNVMNYNPVF